MSGNEHPGVQSNWSDEELVLAAQRDGMQFDALYAKYIGRVFGYFRSRLRTRMDAEDLTAETFHRALRGLPRYRAAEGRFAAWLFRIAHNLLVDHVRRKREVTTLDRIDDVPGDGRDDPSRLALWSEDLRCLAEALRTLPEDTREIIALRINARLSYAEIGEIMGMNEDATKARFHRAIRSLRTRWDTDG